MATLGSPYDREGSWTPTLTFATPGNLSVVYSSRLGLYKKIDRLVHVWFQVITSTFTHTTASGGAAITGLTFARANQGIDHRGTTLWQGITKANYTQVIPFAFSSEIRFQLSGSGQAYADLAAADMPTTGTVLLIGQITYLTS